MKISHCPAVRVLPHFIETTRYSIKLEQTQGKGQAHRTPPARPAASPRRRQIAPPLCSPYTPCSPPARSSPARRTPSRCLRRRASGAPPPWAKPVIKIMGRRRPARRGRSPTRTTELAHKRTRRRLGYLRLGHKYPK